VVIPLNTKNDLVFNVQYSTSSNINNFEDLAEYSNGKLKNAESYYGPQKRFLFSTQLKLNSNKKWLESGVITAAYQDVEESRIQRKFSSLDRTYRIENVDVFSLNGDFFVPLTSAKNRILSYGFEGTHNDVGSNANGRTLEVYGDKVVGFSNNFVVQSRYPDGGGTSTSVATYVNYRQDINKKSTLNTGIRYVNTNLTAKWIDDTFITLPDSDISLNTSAVTATIGYAFKPSNDWQLNGVISSGFRAPNLDDIGKVREKSGNVTVPNTSLEPEYVYNFETSILKYFKEKTFQTGLNVYYTLLSNYITRDYYTINNSETIVYDGEVGNVVANVNKDNAYIVGGTFSLKGNINEQWFTRGSVTYTKGMAYDTKEPLSSIPPIFGLFEIGFEKERFQANVNFKFNQKKKLGDYNLIEGIDSVEQVPFITETNQYYGSPSWNTINFNSNYKINNSITCFVNVGNILDVHYKEFASSISAPGRNLSLSFLFNI
jgi:hemoglobin/transferrin/lactoferrin receptor protein